MGETEKSESSLLFPSSIRDHEWYEQEWGIVRWSDCITEKKEKETKVNAKTGKRRKPFCFVPFSSESLVRNGKRTENERKSSINICTICLHLSVCLFPFFFVPGKQKFAFPIWATAATIPWVHWILFAHSERWNQCWCQRMREKRTQEMKAEEMMITEQKERCWKAVTWTKERPPPPLLLDASDVREAKRVREWQRINCKSQPFLSYSHWFLLFMWAAGIPLIPSARGWSFIQYREQ